MKRFLLIAGLFLTIPVHSQEDLLAGLDTVQPAEKYVTAVFKGLQVVTLQSTKMPARHEFYFVVSHRFGSVKGGISEFFGLDNATTKIGGVYGLADWLSVSVSRHTLLKVYEAGIKYRLARQGNGFPFEIAGYNTVDTNSFIDEDDYPKLEFSDRLTYISQLLLARKCSERLSLELVPSYIHKNLYNPELENNDQISLGAGGRLKITRRMSVNLEYVYNFDSPGYYTNPLSVGLDLETGGHVFQLLFTSSQPMTESGYITQGNR